MIWPLALQKCDHFHAYFIIDTLQVPFFRFTFPCHQKIDHSVMGDGNKLFVDNAHQCFAFTPQAKVKVMRSNLGYLLKSFLL